MSLFIFTWCSCSTASPLKEVLSTCCHTTFALHMHTFLRRTWKSCQTEIRIHLFALSIYWIDCRKLRQRMSFEVLFTEDLFMPAPWLPLVWLQLQLTLHFVVKGKLLSCLNATCGKERYSWQPLVYVINEHIVDLKVGVALRVDKGGTMSVTFFA